MASPFTATYSAEQLEEVRKALRHQLSQLHTRSAIEQMVNELQLSSTDTAPLQPDQALRVLQDKGVVEQIARSITAPPQLVAKHAATNLVQAALAPPHAPPRAPGERYLHVKLLGARAVMDYVARAPLPGEHLRLSVEVLGHRLDSDWVPACEEPTFSGDLYVPLPSSSGDAGQAPSKDGAKAGGGKQQQPEKGAAGLPDPLQLLALRQPLHLVLTASAPTLLPPASELVATVQGPPAQQVGPWPDWSHACSPCAVVALGAGDWRTALLRSKPVVVCVQMSGGPGVSLGVPAGAAPAGVATLQLSLHPAPAAPVDEAVLQTQQRTEAARDAHCAAALVQRTKAWWAQYARLAPELRLRPVKVLARAEDGSQHPSCSFVRPLQLGRAVPTPLHAARLVALLRRRDDDAESLSAAVLGPGSESAAAAAAQSECWCCLHTVLASRSASAEEQALLLCGLLLGFGLDAYVAVGRAKAMAAARGGGGGGAGAGAGHGAIWVVTRGAFAETTHWDPGSGQRFSSLEAAACPFATVGSVFNHCGVWANAQPDDGATSCSYLLEEPSLWHALAVDAAEMPGPGWSTFPLRPSLVDTGAVEALLEQQVKTVLVHHRSTLLPPAQALAPGSTHTVWDVSLEHLLMPALAAYEQEAVSGEVAAGIEAFQSAIKRATPLGFVFKGVPQHHRHVHAAAVAQALVDDPQARDVLAPAGPAPAVLALRVRVTAWPEGLFSTWVMLASKCRTTRSP